MDLLDRVKSLINGDELGCRAVVDKDSGEICGGDVYGVTSLSSGQEIKYCTLHRPSIQNDLKRKHAMTFYDSESEEFIEVE